MSIISCVKDPQDIPSGLEQDPVFGLHGQFGGESIDLNAGVDGWTFMPAVEYKDSLTVYTATLSKDRCLDQCSPSWTFYFYQSISGAGSEEAKFLNTITPGVIDYAISEAERDSFTVTVSTHPDLFMNGISFWEDLNNPDTTFGSTLYATVGNGEGFNACFQSAVYLGCQYQQCIHFDPATLIPCLVYIEARIDSNYVLITARPSGTPPFLIEWEDGLTSPSIVVPIQDLAGDLAVDVTVTDANGNSTELVQTVRFQNGVVDACYYPISLQSTQVTNPTAEILAGDLEIIHVDGEGQKWKSTGGIQPLESMAQINEVRYFGFSPDGLDSYKVNMPIRVLLTNQVSGEAKWFETSELILPLGFLN